MEQEITPKTKIVWQWAFNPPKLRTQNSRTMLLTNRDAIERELNSLPLPLYVAVCKLLADRVATYHKAGIRGANAYHNAVVDLYDALINSDSQTLSDSKKPITMSPKPILGLKSSNVGSTPPAYKESFWKGKCDAGAAGRIPPPKLNIFKKTP